MSKSIVACLLALVASHATAQTIPITLNEAHFGLPDLYQVGTTFNLPDDFTDATLTISTFAVDDRGILVLNGAMVANSGIFGPGQGSFVLIPGGSNQPLFYTSGAGGPFTPITSGFRSGVNSLVILVNDTNAGINGALSGGVNCGFANCLAPTSVSFSGEVSFNTAPVPLPASLPLLGIGAAGVVAKRRRRRPRVASY